MFIRKIVSFLFVILAFTLQQVTFAQTYYSRFFTEADGLINSKVYGMVQDRDGRLWFVTRSGISSFDGSEWNSFAFQGHEQYQNLVMTDDGTILAVSSELKVIQVKDGKLETYYKPNNTKIYSLEISDIAWADTEGLHGILVGTLLNGLFVEEENGWRNIQSVSESPGEKIGIYNILVDDRILLATNQGIAEFQDNKIRLLDKWNKQFPSTVILGLLPIDEDQGTADHFWVVGDSWLGKIIDGKFQLLTKFKSYTNIIPVNHQTCESDGGDGIFFGSPAVVYHYCQERGLHRFDVEEGLLSTGATQVFRDAEGTLWFTGLRGVTEIPSLRFRNYHREQGLLENEVSAIGELPDGKLIFGHNNGYTIYDGDHWETHAFKETNSSVFSRVMDIETDPDLGSWMAVSEVGVLYLDQREWREIPIISDSKVSAITIAFTPDHHMYVTTDNGLFELRDDTFIRSEIVPSINFRNIEVLETGTIYLCSNHDGVFSITDANVTHYLANDKTLNQTYCLMQLDNGKIIIGTVNGLATIENDSIVPWLPGKIKIQRPVYSMVKDNSGNLWFGTDQGYYKWNGTRLRHYSIRSGIAGMEANRTSSFVDSHGNLWLGTNSGLSRYFPDFDAELSTKRLFPVIINSFSVNDDSSTTIYPDRIPYGAVFTIRYSLPSYLEEGVKRYFISVDRVGSSWSNRIVTGAEELTFSTLPPGNYRISIYAEDGLGRRSPVTESAEFLVPQPFFRSSWFIVLVILSAAGLFFLVSRLFFLRRLQVKLQEQVERRTEEIEAMFRNATDVIYLKDTDLRYSKVNPALESAYQLPAREIIGKRIDELFDNPEVEDILKYDRNVIAGATVDYHQKIQFMGKTIFIHTVETPLRDADGNIVGIFGITRDVTDVEKSRQELLEKEAILSEAQRIGRIGNWQYDISSESMIWSENLYQLFDIKKSEITLQFDSFNQFIHPDDRDKRDEEIAKVLEQGGRTELEYRVIKPDGSLRYFSSFVELQHFGNGEPMRVIGTVQDITERKQAELALRESEERYRIVVETISEGLAVADAEEKFVLVNQAMANILGVPLKELIGHSLEEFLTEKEKKVLRKQSDRRIQRMNDRYELEIIRPDGEKRIVLVSAVPRLDKDGNYDGAYGVFQDITEVRKAQEAQKKLDASLQEARKLESLGKLAGGIAHDFNNLLHSILGNTELARMESGQQMDINSTLDEITKATERASQLTQMMLAYSGYGRFVLNDLSLSELLEKMKPELLKPLPKTITLHLELSADLPKVTCDEAQVRQMISNIVENSREAIGQRDGNITLRTGVRYCDRKYLDESVLGNVLNEGTYVFIDIIDDGEGIKGEHLTNIFDPFFSTRFTGRGLGLAAVHGIIRGHKGAIRVKSKVNHGTTFTIFLPPTEAIEPPKDDQLPAESEDSIGHKILIVDDDDSLLDVVDRVLTHAGYNTVTASTGNEALEIFRTMSSSLDLVVLDLSLPDMTGDTILEEMIKIDPQVRVILSSGYGIEDVQRILTPGTYLGFINKPFRANQLLEYIEKHLGKN